MKWRASGGAAYGKIVSIHTASTVPGTAHHLAGNPDQPAARIQVHKRTPQGGYLPTDNYIAQTLGGLIKLDPDLLTLWAGPEATSTLFSLE